MTVLKLPKSKQILYFFILLFISNSELAVADVYDEFDISGNIAFQSYDESTKQVRVILQGACSGCPSSTVTLKNGIETMLKDMLPNQINEVVAING